MKTNEYSIAKFKGSETRRGYQYRYDLTRQKKKVAEVYNDGNGGMTFINFITPHEHNLFQEFTLEEAPDQIEANRYEMLGNMADLLSYVIQDPVYCLKKCGLTTFANTNWQEFYDLFYKDIT